MQIKFEWKYVYFRFVVKQLQNDWQMIMFENAFQTSNRNMVLFTSIVA